MTSPLLRRPLAATGLIQSVTPRDAGWGHVGFHAWRLAPGQGASGTLGPSAPVPPHVPGPAVGEGTEAVLMLVEGRARIRAAGRDWGEMGDRLSLWDRTPPHALYLPPGSDWQVEATTDAVLALCTAPSPGGRPAQDLTGGVIAMDRGRGANTRHIHNVAMEAQDVADSLLVTEVYTPAGNWSSYPSHRHDEDDFPRITYLEETYYHRLNPGQGFAFQRIYTDDGSLDEAIAVQDHDVTLVPRGHHPCGAPYGYDLYYLNVMAGPRRAWRFEPDPKHRWIMERDG